MQLNAQEMRTLPGQACHPASDKDCSYQSASFHYKFVWQLNKQKTNE